MLATSVESLAIISIHAPRTGSDPYCHFVFGGTGGFQSTLPARGATFGENAVGGRRKIFQSTLPARGATAGPHSTNKNAISFQSTLPARGATAHSFFSSASRRLFQSTLPARGATLLHRSPSFLPGISIHAPRTGSDRLSFAEQQERKAISIHAPRTGSDLVPPAEREIKCLFQSTLPARGATLTPSISARNRVFQSTLPARGATIQRSINKMNEVTFQSTLPARGATTCFCASRTRRGYFNPRSPHGERHPPDECRERNRPISIHAPRTGSDRGSARCPTSRE